MGFNIYICLKQLVTDVKSSIKSNPVWFIFQKSLQIFQYISEKKLIKICRRLQTFHWTSSITKYTFKSFIAFVVTSPACVRVCFILGDRKNTGDLYYVLLAWYMIVFIIKLIVVHELKASSSA